jgi:hypothetical protein
MVTALSSQQEPRKLNRGFYLQDVGSFKAKRKCHESDTSTVLSRRIAVVAHQQEPPKPIDLARTMNPAPHFPPPHRYPNRDVLDHSFASQGQFRLPFAPTPSFPAERLTGNLSSAPVSVFPAALSSTPLEPHDPRTHMTGSFSGLQTHAQPEWVRFQEPGQDPGSLGCQPTSSAGQPRNAFRIFVARSRPSLQKAYPTMNDAQATRILGAEWAAMSPEATLMYEREATREQEAYQRTPKQSSSQSMDHSMHNPSLSKDQVRERELNDLTPAVELQRRAIRSYLTHPALIRSTSRQRLVQQQQQRRDVQMTRQARLAYPFSSQQQYDAQHEPQQLRDEVPPPLPSRMNDGRAPFTSITQLQVVAMQRSRAYLHDPPAYDTHTASRPPPPSFDEAVEWLRSHRP